MRYVTAFRNCTDFSTSERKIYWKKPLLTCLLLNS